MFYIMTSIIASFFTKIYMELAVAAIEVLSVCHSTMLFGYYINSTALHCSFVGSKHIL